MKEGDVTTMPRRDEVDPMFDGHPERPWHELTADEKLDWIWEGMCLLRIGEQTRAARLTARRPTPT